MMPADLFSALSESKETTSLWESLTPISRNEFICWVEDAKQKNSEVADQSDRGRTSRRPKAPMLLDGLHSSHRQETEQMAAKSLDRSEAKKVSLIAAQHTKISPPQTCRL